MILIDTNIISELMKASPDESVLNWFDQQVTSTLFVTAITVAEIMYGLEVMPIGRRKVSLIGYFKQVIEKSFRYRILPFDETASLIYGTLMASRKKAGKPMSVCDGQIAAIAIAQGMQVATHNTRDFLDCGLMLVDPFCEIQTGEKESQ